jgi:hypothetical protein
MKDTQILKTQKAIKKPCNERDPILDEKGTFLEFRLLLS